MKTIVVPTDFSSSALNAVNYAADLANGINAININIALVHVCQIPVQISEVPVPVENIDNIMKDAEKHIHKLKEQLLHKTGGKIKITTEVRLGRVIPEIEEFCEDVKPYAIVMGTRGAGAVERFLFGSNTIQAIKMLSWPLIVVPPGARFTKIGKIGLACDYDHVMESVPVNEIKGILKDFHAELHVLYVDHQQKDKHGIPPKVLQESGWLQEMLDEVHPDYHFVKGDDVDEKINEFADKNNLDLLIVIPKKHGFAEQIFHKSHAKQLALHSHVPILSLHEQH